MINTNVFFDLTDLTDFQVLLAGVKTDAGQNLVDITTQKNGKVKDRSWNAAKKSLLGSVGKFLDGLMDYKKYVDAFQVPKINWREVRPYLKWNILRWRPFRPKTVPPVVWSVGW